MCKGFVNGAGFVGFDRERGAPTPELSLRSKLPQMVVNVEISMAHALDLRHRP